MKFEIIKNQLFKNTIILLITNLIIRGLGLINRLILVRTLGENAISLYTLILPTIMLFLSISCFSLNTAMIKVTANNKTKKAIKSGIYIAIITSSISSLILLLILKTLSKNLLNQPDTYYPILASIPLFYVTSISTVLRGYLTGIEKISTTSIANTLEQISRILFIIIIFIFIKNKPDITYVILCVIAMTIGEIFSIIFTSINIKKQKEINKNNVNETKIKKELLDISIPSTLNSISSNLTFFLEPIIFTYSLKLLNNNSNDILFKYSEVSTFALPLISLFSFISISISTALMPKLSTASNKEISKKLPKVIFWCLLPAIFVSTVLFYYNDNISLLLYKTTTGSILVKKYVWLFLPSYLIYPFNTILITRNKSKQIFIVSLIVHIIKLLSIFVLPFISNDGLMISYIIAIYITFIIQVIMLYKNFKIKFNINKIISLIIITIIINLCSILLNLTNIIYLIQIIILFIIFVLLLFFIINRNNK